ncbi:hypothetical protein Q5424_22810 [Conexibacter sp. JD483]|uniref:hypothetical protein n=1 Tax=unclassified Conexibacter TaxID=2627773 RepID=UPI00272655EB|nr:MULTISPECIES: hypothetical protein [unclassified Conexibacter]MDO8189189.1 hypothetical protein [Conexibacter sp. CPCC 205706]MDO8201922.1 hypothetical protein [Conexibacter sp. CPCC 205762]MDR9371947.1 hypothetical protein [Conexibacter sp. JD483]
MGDGLVPFRVLSDDAEVAHGPLAVALGAEFESLRAASLDAALAPLVAELAPHAAADPAAQLLAAETAFSQHLRTEAREHRDLGVGDLLPHQVAERGRGHELAVMLVALEAARRAGIELGIVACEEAIYIAHPQLDAPVLLAAEPEQPWALVDARELAEQELEWQCAHEAVALLLGLILERTHETGHLAHELLAAELWLALPLDDDEQERAQTRLASVRARLN